MHKTEGLVSFKIMVWFGFLLSMLVGSSLATAADENILWEKLSDGAHFAIVRHALAPGVGDPANFTLEDCNTQRNLSEKGRTQAKQIGELFRQNGVTTAKVFSSQWCRCQETAELLDFGDVEELPVINSFFRNFENEESQTSALINWLDKQNLKQNIILITHQVNITAFTDIFPSSGEIVVVNKRSRGNYIAVGTIKTDSLHHE